MRFTTVVTQKGQVTLPKTLRESLGISPYEKVVVEVEKDYLKITPTTDLLELAGEFKSFKSKKSGKKKGSVLEARDAFEEGYSR